MTDSKAQEAKAPKEPTEPKVVAPSKTHISLSNYINAHSEVQVSPEQAQALLTLHGKWQRSPERVAERTDEAAEAKIAADALKVERAAQKVLADEAKLEKAKEKKAKDEAKAAAKAAKAGDDSDLDEDDLDDDDDDDIDEDDTEDAEEAPEAVSPAPAKRRTRKGGADVL